MLDVITQKHLPPRDLMHQEKLPVFPSIAIIVAVTRCQANMAAAPTNPKLVAIIAQLQAQVNALQNAAPAATATPPACAAPVVFADTFQTLGANDLINYLPKRGSAIFEQG
jgi:hypothetical protein